MDTMSVQEAAQQLDCTQKTIYRYLESGKLTSQKIGMMHFIPAQEVESLRLSRHIVQSEDLHLEDRVDTLYELVGTLDFRVRELEEQVRSLKSAQTSPETRQEALQTPVPRRTEPQHIERERLRTVVSEMPDSLIGLAEYARQCGIPPTTLKKAVVSGRVPIVHGRWKVGRAYVQEALDEDGRRKVQELYPKRQESLFDE